MKKLIYLILLFISIVLINTVQAAPIEETITLDKTLTFEQLKYIYGYESNYITISEIDNNSLITIYNNQDELLVQKQLENLKNTKIIKYNDNFILVGLSGNALKVINIDSNLIVKKQEETSILINSNYELNLYNYDNKIFVILTNNNTLADTKIYEINNELNITENGFSSYDSNYLKGILKDDYYSLIHNDENIEDKIYHYNDSAYMANNNILIGNNDTNAILKMLDNTNNEILRKEYNEFEDFLNIAIINKKILILAKKENKYYLIELNETGEIQDQEELEDNDISLLKTGDKLLIISRDKQTTIKVYNYLCDITVEDSPLGTIQVQNSSEPFRKVSIQATPNSGYVLESLIIRDSEDNIIQAVNNEFTMPDDNVVVIANYKQTVNNPETMDIILFFVIVSIITLLIMNKSYVKYKWLKQ